MSQAGVESVFQPACRAAKTNERMETARLAKQMIERNGSHTD